MSDIYQKSILLMIHSRRQLFCVCERLGLTTAQGMFLMMMTGDEARPMNELSCRLGCDASNVTGLVDRLDSAGLIERTVDNSDRRVKLVKLSKKGKIHQQMLLANLEKTDFLNHQKLSAKEKAQLGQLIDKLMI